MVGVFACRSEGPPSSIMHWGGKFFFLNFGPTSSRVNPVLRNWFPWENKGSENSCWHPCFTKLWPRNCKAPTLHTATARYLKCSLLVADSVVSYGLFMKEQAYNIRSPYTVASLSSLPEMPCVSDE